MGDDLGYKYKGFLQNPGVNDLAAKFGYSQAPFKVGLGANAPAPIVNSFNIPNWSPAAGNSFVDRSLTTVTNPSQPAGVGFGANINWGNYGIDNSSSVLGSAASNNWWDDYIGKDKLFASGGDALKGVGSLLGGVGSIAQAWTAMKGLDMAEQAMNMQNEQWKQNYEAQRTATNNAIANQNAWKAASGRTDLGAYVGDWSNAQNLQPQR